MTKRALMVGSIGLVLFAVMIVVATTGSKLWLIPMFACIGCGSYLSYQRRMR